MSMGATKPATAAAERSCALGALPLGGTKAAEKVCQQRHAAIATATIASREERERAMVPVVVMASG
eukprot:CAMPEP_0183389262 /NCGR_PEP_ID=MMETSP0370-20130417/4819_1 /TAXON_ID=268820 /ORGANISM="Peridinium aciculiferum, Strain PAER-2" /LENGTH=65 /DNA_ID=CAMNT_0025568473 /DNA_START=66 /DNA_END=263 /DNA_ORIENTATION=-